jgi:hypothetical protein
VLTFVAIVVCIGASFAACSQYKRVAGESCLKDDDCVSNICAEQLCMTAPPSLPPDTGYGQPDSSSGGIDSGTDAGGGGDSSDSSSSSDSGSDGDGPPQDSGIDVIDAFVADASDAGSPIDAADATGDALADGASESGTTDGEADASNDVEDGASDALEPTDGAPDAPITDGNLPG